jgi:CO/xanthine dehydrogenase Mo-binding subunit
MKKKGVGISLVLHPSGNKGADDPSTAAVQLKPDGTYVLLIGCSEIGNGSVTIMRQIAADTLECPIEDIFCSNFADDFAPLSQGAFASRSTLIDSHAVENACLDLKEKVRVWAAEKAFNVPKDQITVAKNKVWITGHEDEKGKSLTMREVGPLTYIAAPTLDFIVGIGYWMPDKGATPHDPETGAMPAVKGISYGSVYLEVELDTETGIIDLTRLCQVWEVGKAINPLLCKSQINGGLSIGIGLAQTEDLYPYDDLRYTPASLGDYLTPTFLDYPQDTKWGYVEVPNPYGVEGSKGFSEGSSNGLGPVLMNALHDATGIWLNSYPVSPEKVLRALKAAN